MSQNEPLTAALERQRDSDKAITFIKSAGESTELRFADLYTCALQLLAGFRERGVQAGDEVVIYVDDNEAFVKAFWACMYGAMIPVPIAVGAHREHLQKLFNVLAKLKNPRIFSQPAVIERVRQFAADHPTDFDLTSRCLTMDDSRSDTAEPHELAGQRDRLAFIQFSSGSTREPKGVMLTHGNLVSNIEAMRSGAQYTPEDKILSWMPLTHDMGLIGMHLAPLYCEMNHCLMPTPLFSRRPLLWLKKVSELRCNITCSPNFGYKHFLKGLGDKQIADMDLSHVRLIYNGAEPISVELCEQFLSTLQPYGLKSSTLFLVYGLAEGTLAVSFPQIHTPFRAVSVSRDSLSVGHKVERADEGSDGTIKLACVGKAVSSCDIRIALDGEALQDERVGEVLIKGPGVTQGYYRDEAVTKEVISTDGWLNTGDLGFISDGELVITGRAKEIIFANGQNFYPQDLEAVIQQETGIELGRVMATSAKPEGSQTEQLLIFVVFRKGVDDFRPLEHQITRLLSEQLGLEVSHVLPVPNIPKTTSGKLQRGQLARAYLNGEYNDLINELKPRQSGDQDFQGDVMQQLHRICVEVAPDKSIGPGDDLFEMGLSSLQLAELHERIDQVYPGVVDISDLFSISTLTDIAQFIESKR